MANLKLPFPMQGKNENWAASHQLKFTSPDLNNVRPYDVLENRARGGQRPGLKKVFPAHIGGDVGQPVVAMCQVTTVEG